PFAASETGKEKGDGNTVAFSRLAKEV
ncbi:MAG: hypothetical protein QOG78_730, partial [Rhodospirillaceae bacterium]|nr:hypothetical protein [Rhodospirillaceae bacterium]